MLNYLEKGRQLWFSYRYLLSACRLLQKHTPHPAYSPNVPGVLSAINTALSANKINILGQYLKTNDQIGYMRLRLWIPEVIAGGAGC